MLPRSLSYIYENLRDFSVVKDKNIVIGCCALHICWKDLAEIKSLAVDPIHHGKGVGKELVSACIMEARQLGLKSIFTLTLESEFFKKLGFKDISKEKLPMKIWGECMHCNKYPDCDEEALIYEL